MFFILQSTVLIKKPREAVCWNDGMDSPICLRKNLGSTLHRRGDQVFKRKESDMHATTVAVDLAKSVFQLAVADDQWRIVETRRLTRSQFERWFVNRSVGLVIMEACGSAHHWARLRAAQQDRCHRLGSSHLR